MRNNKTKIFLTVLLVYLFYIAPSYVTAGTNRYIALTKSVVEDKIFNIDKYMGYTCDKGSYGGHYYIGAAPGLSLLAAPFYVILKPLLRSIPQAIYQNFEFSILNLFFAFFLSVLPGTVIAVLLYDLLQKFDMKEKERVLTVFICAFGTILFYYSTRFLSQTLGAFALFSAFYILFRSKSMPSGNSSFFLTGVCLGLAVLTDYILVIGSFLIFIYGILSFKKDKILNYVFLILGALLVTAIYAYYHYRCFDNPFAMATTYSDRVGRVPLSLPRLRMIFELTFGTYRGAFMYMPILLFSVYGMLLFFKKPEKKYMTEMLLISAFSLSVFIVIAMFASWIWPWGGDFGPRYFLCFVPFLMMPLVFVYKKVKYKIVLWVAALSMIVNWCGVQYGDADSPFINIGLFIFRGLNSNLAQWLYSITTHHIRSLNVITHFSPLIPFLILLFLLYAVWKTEINGLIRSCLCNENSIS